MCRSADRHLIANPRSITLKVHLAISQPKPKFPFEAPCKMPSACYKNGHKVDASWQNGFRKLVCRCLNLGGLIISKLHGRALIGNIFDRPKPGAKARAANSRTTCGVPPKVTWLCPMEPPLYACCGHRSIRPCAHRAIVSAHRNYQGSPPRREPHQVLASLPHGARTARRHERPGVDPDADLRFGRGSSVLKMLAE